MWRTAPRKLMAMMSVCFIAIFAFMGLYFLPTAHPFGWSPTALLPLGILIGLALLLVFIRKRARPVARPLDPQGEANAAVCPYRRKHCEMRSAARAPEGVAA
jgi:hypothetical protein